MQTTNNLSCWRSGRASSPALRAMASPSSGTVSADAESVVSSREIGSALRFEPRSANASPQLLLVEGQLAGGGGGRGGDPIPPAKVGRPGAVGLGDLPRWQLEM